ncbi:MAG: S-ribosylhomocysteine lyase [Ruminococcaceae bacterium]|nr:S-ribosylhomocysteine lyase [Oscillospiraceae bacterium]
MERIASFNVDHNLLDPGIYVSRRDGDITTYDLRTRKPNAGDYMDNITMHTVEHMFATYIRNSEISDKVIYFGPMGCRTGFYLLIRGEDDGRVLRVVFEVLEKIIAHDGEVFGASAVECGNYRELDLASAKRECEKYLAVLRGRVNDFIYRT